MIRKSLFWGLTLVLIVALVSLIVRGRRLEKEQAASPSTVIQQSKPTSTRVLAPEDLQIVESSMRLDSGNTARHRIKIRNNGTVSYSRIQLEFVYLDGKGKPLATRTFSTADAIKPGTTAELGEITIRDAPTQAARSDVSILYADLGNDASVPQ